MSDYLTRLVERSLGSAPQIEPLIAPLHAPSYPLPDEQTEPVAGSARAAKATMQFPEDDTTSGEDPNRGNVQEKEADAAEPPRIGQKPPRRSTRPLELPIESPSEERPESLHPELPLPPAPLRQPPSPPVSPALARASVPIAPPIPPGEEPPGIVAQPTIKKRLGAADVSHDLPPLPAKIATVAPGPTGIVVQPRINPPRQTPGLPSLFARQPSATEPPAIHVTIGRVEVRAVMSPPTPPKRAASPPTAPRISLEEYLKQRNGGRP